MALVDKHSPYHPALLRARLTHSVKFFKEAPQSGIYTGRNHTTEHSRRLSLDLEALD